MTLKDIQKAMLGIMSQLSSYSVQYIQQINESALVMLDWGHVRWHYLGGSAKHQFRLPTTLAVPLDFYGRANIRKSIDLSGVTIQALDRHASHEMGIDLSIDYKLSGLNTFLHRGLSINALFGVVSQPKVDLSTMTNTALTIPPLSSRPIADLFDRTETNVFTNP